MRHFVRHNADIPVRVRYQDREYDYALLNVSLGGVACKGEYALPVGGEVEVSFPLLKPLYTASGAVVWCRELHDVFDIPLFELGIEHLGEKDKPRLRMVEQISHIEHYRKEVKLTEGRSLSGEEAAREWIAIHMDDF